MQGGSKWTERQLTNEPHPFPMLKDMQKEIIRYKRDDDVDLTATLHLPPGYDAERDGPLPGIMWAYPRCAAASLRSRTPAPAELNWKNHLLTMLKSTACSGQYVPTCYTLDLEFYDAADAISDSALIPLYHGAQVPQDVRLLVRWLNLKSGSKIQTVIRVVPLIFF